MTKDPFVLEQPQDPFAGKKKVAELIISMYEGAPPNLGIHFEPQTMSPMKMMGLLIDSIGLFYKMAVNDFKKLQRSGIEIVKTADDKALRNGN